MSFEFSNELIFRTIEIIYGEIFSSRGRVARASFIPTKQYALRVVYRRVCRGVAVVIRGEMFVRVLARVIDSTLSCARLCYDIITRRRRSTDEGGRCAGEKGPVVVVWWLYARLRYDIITRRRRSTDKGGRRGGEQGPL